MKADNESRRRDLSKVTNSLPAFLSHLFQFISRSCLCLLVSALRCIIKASLRSAKFHRQSHKSDYLFMTYIDISFESRTCLQTTTYNELNEQQTILG